MNHAAEIQETLTKKLGAYLIGLVLEQRSAPTSYIVAWRRWEEQGEKVVETYGTHRAWENTGTGRPFELESGHYRLSDRDAAIYDMLDRAGYHVPADDLVKEDSK